MVGENRWYMVGDNIRYIVAANYWYILGDNTWYIIERKMRHVRYECTSRLLHHISLAHADGSYPDLLDGFARVELLVLDDWLRDPLTRPQSQVSICIRDWATNVHLCWSTRLKTLA